MARNNAAAAPVAARVKTLSIIVTSTRPTRIGHRLGEWIAAQIPAEEWDARVVDLGELSLLMLDEEDMPRNGNYRLPHTQAWARTVAESDGILILTPEYNASFTAPLKNAIDVLYAEWNRKPIGVIGYGWRGAARATAALSPVLGNVGADERGVLHLTFREDIAPDGSVLSTTTADRVVDLARKLA